MYSIADILLLQDASEVEIAQSTAALRETQMKLNQTSEVYLKLQFDFDRLTEDLRTANLKISELSDLLNAK